MEPFRVHFVAGVTPDKWARIWAQRMPQAALEVTLAGADPVRDLHTGICSMCFVRLPVERDGLHVIPLYDEVPVVVVGAEHPVAAFEQVDVGDLAHEQLVQPSRDVPEWLVVADPERAARADAMPVMTSKQAVSVVAAGSGILVLPLSLARLYHRKDVVHRPLSGVASTTIGLAWRVDDHDERVEAFIGIVRGRTERSTRGPAPSGSATHATAAATAGRRAKGSAPTEGKGSTPGAKRSGGPASRNSPPRRRRPR